MRHLQIVRDEPPEPYRVTATPGWPPVAIPGRPAWWRHCIDGQQVDLPRDAGTTPTDQEGPSCG